MTGLIVGMSGRAGVCVWFTGLSGSGKSTTADALIGLHPGARPRGHGARRGRGADAPVEGSRLQPRGSRHQRPAHRLRGVRGRAAWRHRGRGRGQPVSRDARRGARDDARRPRSWRSSWTRPSRSARTATSRAGTPRRAAGEVTAFTGVDDPYEPPLHAELTLHTVDTTRRGECPARCSGRWRPGATWRRPDHVARAPPRGAARRAWRWTWRTGSRSCRSEALLRRPVDPTMALVILPDDAPAAVAPSGRRRAGRRTCPRCCRAATDTARTPADLLRRLYPGDHPVHGLDGAPDTTVGALIAPPSWPTAPTCCRRCPTCCNAASPWGLPWLVARLRAPGGCPWDREQDHRSLRPFLLEEAYEVYDALEEPVGPKLAEELGDLLLQIVLHAQYAAEAGIFDLSDVQRSIMTKIVRRHPHVFGDGAAQTAGEVTRDWEVIKADERAAAAEDGTPAVAGRPGHARRVRGPVALVARARLRERDAGPRRQPGLRLARPRGRHRQDRRGGDRAAPGQRPGAPHRGVR